VTAFDDIIGHRHVLDLLSAELVNPAQAYLFVGPGSVGKAAVAHRFAVALLCGADAGCLDRAMRRIHPDLMLIEPEGRASITVDQARHVVAVASLAPLEADRRVFLFEEGGMMNDEAASALLKTLEEPSAGAVFIIVAESEDELPDTVASRCRTVVFGRVGEEELVTGLGGLGLDEDQARQAARISGGRPGLALALATRPEVADFRRVWLSIPMRLPEHPGDAFRLAEEVLEAADPLLVAVKERHEEALAAEDGRDGRATRDRQARELRRATDALLVTGLEILASFYRDVAAAQFGGGVRNSDVPVTAFTKIAPATALSHAERVLDTIDVLRAHQRPQLAFATLFADLGSDG